MSGPAVRLLLKRRAAAGREDRTRLDERFGRSTLRRPDGRLIWLHGASLGEAFSMLPLIGALKQADPALTVLVTTGTVTSARRLAPLLPDGAIHQFVPVDLAGAVERFLDHWRPDLAIWVESEFWPRLMTETGNRGIPMMLINARLSERSANRWGWTPGMARTLVRSFDQVLTQDTATRERLIRLGADPGRVEEAGNLKVALPPPGADCDALRRLRGAVGDRPVWLAASTHDPEEALVAEAHRLAAARLPGLLTLLAPRHPERGYDIGAALEREGLGVTFRTRGLPRPDTEVYLADTLGEMGLWMRLAPVSFVGGSVAPMGGHNPFEPAALGSVVLHGPQTQNFAPAYAALDRAGGALLVEGPDELAETLTRLSDPAGMAERQRITDAARTTIDRLTPDVAAIAGRALALMGRG